MTDSKKKIQPEEVKKIDDRVKNGEVFKREFINQVKDYQRDVGKEKEKLAKATDKDKKLLADLQDHWNYVDTVICRLESRSLQNVSKEFGKTEEALTQGVSSLKNKLKSGPLKLDSFKPIQDTFKSLLPPKK
jgi:vacuolar-type H+-ATPase subunit I/STV1